MCDNNNTQSIADYLAQLLKDKKQLAAFPNVFLHVERLLDDGKRNHSLKCLCIFVYFADNTDLCDVLCMRQIEPSISMYVELKIEHIAKTCTELVFKIHRIIFCIHSF